MPEPGSLLGRGIGSGVRGIRLDTFSAEFSPFLKYNRVDKHGPDLSCVWVRVSCCMLVRFKKFWWGAILLLAVHVAGTQMARHNFGWGQL